MKFSDLIPAEGATSEALRAAVARADAEGKAAASRLDALTADRGRALVEDDDAALDRVEAEIATTRRTLDRADLAVEELRRRLAEAEEAERRARLDALHARGTAARDRGVALIKGKYSKLARDLAALADELFAAADEVEAVNRALAEGGDPRRVADADLAARPRPPGRFFPAVAVALVLPDPADPASTLWPPPAPPMGVAA